MLKISEEFLNNEVSQKIHLCSFLLISVTDVVQVPGQSAGAAENLVLMMRYCPDSSSVLSCLLFCREFKVCCTELITYNSIKPCITRDVEENY